MFSAGVMLIGFGSGLFGHGTLTATMNYAPRDKVGMALGAWGAVQATAAGLGAALGGGLRDGFAGLPLARGWPVVANGYVWVYALEIALLAATIVAMLPLLGRRRALSAG
jgi:BCD family chlorophyll transporter-like MFS transporter